MDLAWCWRNLAIFVTALSVCGCQTVGSIRPGENILPLGTAQPAEMIPVSLPMPVGYGHGPIPPGFVSFCMRFSSQCDVPENQSETISLTSQYWGLFGQINRQVNNSIWPEDDERHYGRPEYWNIPTDGYGDCEDYALTKRKILIDAGLT